MSAPPAFVIDAKWQGKYGLLQHSPQRFPHFEQILVRIRSDGHHLGMWAAFMRCEDPGDLGLETRHMLQRADGSPMTVKMAAEFGGIAQATASVVVSSRTTQGIQHASQLAIVPYGNGELKIKRSDDEAKQAEMVEHVWGGQVGTRNRITIEGGMLIIPLRERTSDGVQVEWIELNYARIC